MPRNSTVLLQSWEWFIRIDSFVKMGRVVADIPDFCRELVGALAED
jgi:hypothetical protein